MEKVLLENPYMENLVIRDPHIFVGRGELLSRIYGVIAANGSISLVGPARIGKGSILHGLRFKELQQQYGKEYAEKLLRCIFVFIDMRADAQRNWESFFKRLNKAIVAQSRDMLSLDNVPTEGSEGFTALVDEITDQGYRLVLALDSFEKLKENERLSVLLPMFLRSESARVSYIVASTLPLAEIFTKEPLDSPFYNIFPHYEKVGGLAPADARELVVRPTRACFSEEEIAWIIQQAGTHPLFLQRTCQVLFDRKALTPTVPADFEQAEEVVYQALFPHFTALWHSMSEQQQEQLAYTLHRSETQDFFESALFQRFVAIQFEGDTAITVEDVQNALKIWNDAPLLGKSKLRHLKVVTNRLKETSCDPSHPSQSEYGLALQAVMAEAWDNLKGPGIRSDYGQGWESYNILYYCYFKHHMKNEHVRVRLSMSIRTYYRCKKKAIERLLRALQAMENRGNAHH